MLQVPDLAGLEVDLDHGDVRAEGVGRVGLREVAVGLEVGGRGLLGEVLPADGASGRALHPPAPGFRLLDVLGGRLQQLGGMLLRLLLENLRRLHDGATRQLDGTRGARPVAARHRPRVGPRVLDLLEVDAQRVRRQLRHRGLVALSMVGRARGDQEGTVGPQFHRGELVNEWSD